MNRYRLTIQYVGTRYSGWQYQANADTIQGRVQDALEKLFEHKITLHGVGRTDEGVHAERYTAHFDSEKNIELSKVMLGANAYLPCDISVIGAELAPSDFSARYSAKSKTYLYRLYVSVPRLPMLDVNHLQIYKEVDLVLMHEAAKLIEGVHDFSAFQATGSNLVGTVREVYGIEIVPHGIEIDIFVKGNAFLYNMVRNIAGVLLWVGQHRLSVDDVKFMLEAGKRRKYFKTLPSRGLTLVEAEY